MVIIAIYQNHPICHKDYNILAMGSRMEHAMDRKYFASKVKLRQVFFFEEGGVVIKVLFRNLFIFLICLSFAFLKQDKTKLVSGVFLIISLII